MITINRKIFLNLTNIELKKTYIYDLVSIYTYEKGIDDIKTIEYLTNGILNVIQKNEQIINKYGIKKYIDENYPAKDHVSGYYYSTGKYVICPFDWSLEDDQNFDYSFTVAKNL